MIFVVARHGDDVGLAQWSPGSRAAATAQVTALYIVPAGASGPDPSLQTLRRGRPHARGGEATRATSRPWSPRWGS
jgi:hypothetical protein